MTTTAPDLNRLAHLRLFNPMVTLAMTAWGHDSPELDAQLAVMIAFVKYNQNPHCLVCEDPVEPTDAALMGYEDVPGGKVIFAV
jgi:hypothetical protein